MSLLFQAFRLFDGFRSPGTVDPNTTAAIELRDANGAYLLDADGKQLAVTA